MARIAIVTFFMLGALAAAPEAADSTTCSTTINGGTLPTVIVPAGEICTIVNAERPRRR